MPAIGQAAGTLSDQGATVEPGFGTEPP